MRPGLFLVRPGLKTVIMTPAGIDSMDEIDRTNINMIQEDFPLTARPFDEIGERAGVSEADALERVKKAKQEGYIRRIGPVLEPKKLVFTQHALRSAR